MLPRITAGFEFMCDDGNGVTIKMERWNEDENKVEKVSLNFPLDSESIKVFNIFTKGVGRTKKLINLNVRNFYFKMEYRQKPETPLIDEDAETERIEQEKKET